MPTRLASTALALLACLGFAVAAPGDAHAAWGSTGSGAAAQKAITMPAGSAPTSVSGINLSPVGRTFTITWPTAMLHAGRPATGYLITRTNTTGGTLLSGGTCMGALTLGVSGVYTPTTPGAATQSCTDTTLVSLGTVRYTITPVYAKWIGAPSVTSAPTI